MVQAEFPTMFVIDMGVFVGGAIAGEYLEDAVAVEAEQMGLGRAVSLLVGIPVAAAGIMGMMMSEGTLNAGSEMLAAFGTGMLANGVADLVVYGLQTPPTAVRATPGIELVSAH